LGTAGKISSRRRRMNILRRTVHGTRSIDRRRLPRPAPFGTWLPTPCEIASSSWRSHEVAHAHVRPVVAAPGLLLAARAAGAYFLSDRLAAVAAVSAAWSSGRGRVRVPARDPDVAGARVARKAVTHKQNRAFNADQRGSTRINADQRGSTRI